MKLSGRIVAMAITAGIFSIPAIDMASARPLNSDAWDSGTLLVKDYLQNGEACEKDSDCIPGGKCSDTGVGILKICTGNALSGEACISVNDCKQPPISDCYYGKCTPLSKIPDADNIFLQDKDNAMEVMPALETLPQSN
jgi:hypothetical protein